MHEDPENAVAVEFPLLPSEEESVPRGKIGNLRQQDLGKQ